jgi:hypothetical protein
MAEKLGYAEPTTPSRGRPLREMLVDALVGSCLILGGLISIVFLVFATGDVSSSTDFDEIFEKPSRRVRRGFVRIIKGREAARNYPP